VQKLQILCNTEVLIFTIYHYTIVFQASIVNSQICFQLVGIRLVSGIFGKKRLNARDFVREFLQSSMLHRPGKSLKRCGKSLLVCTRKNFFCLVCAGFLWETS